MNLYTFAVLAIGAVAVSLVGGPWASASVISCPPSNYQETNPGLRQLCYAIEQVISDNNAMVQDAPYAGRMVDERNVNAKRQDVDHVFLRFGRRFGL